MTVVAKVRDYGMAVIVKRGQIKKASNCVDPGIGLRYFNRAGFVAQSLGQVVKVTYKEADYTGLGAVTSR